MLAQGNALGKRSPIHPSPEGAAQGGWSVVPLGSVVDINPRPELDKLDDGKLASFIPMKCVEEEIGQFAPLGDRRVGAVRKGYTPFRDGDVIFAKVTSCMEDGKAAVMRGLTNGIGFGSTEFFALRPKERLDASYLFHFVVQKSFRRQAAQNMTGAVGLRRVPKSYMELQPIPLPPLSEQRRIVAEIEKQFTRLEVGVAALRRVQANLKRYRAAVLKAACEGKLVPTEAELARQRAASHPGGVRAISRGSSASDTPGKKSREIIHPEGVAERAAGAGIPSGCGDSWNDVPGVSSRQALLNPRLIAASPPGFESHDFESGEQLLKRILSERRKHWQGRGQYKEPAAPDTADLPPLPVGWTWASVEQLLREPLCNGVSVKGTDHPPGVRALRLSAMSNSGFDYSQSRYLPLSESDVEDIWIQEGDFFMSRGNGSLHLVGRGTSAQKPPYPTIFPDTMIRLRLADAILKSGWLRSLWPSRLVRSQIETRVKTTAGIYKIAQPQVEGMVLPLPPLAEQTRIVAEVERRLSVVEELESVVSANLQRAARLRQSILHKAFTGELEFYGQAKTKSLCI